MSVYLSVTYIRINGIFKNHMYENTYILAF